MVKVIIFDVGGVLFDWYMYWYYEYLAKRMGIEESEIRRVVIPLMKRMDVGEITLKRMEGYFGKAFGIPGSRLEWVDGMAKLGKPNKKMVELVKALSKGYKIYVLSNDTKSRYRFLRKLMYNQLQSKGYVKKFFASCYMGVAKPDRRAYTDVLRSLKIKPSEAIFIDNSKVNVDAASRVGIHALLFTTYPKLVADLRKLKLSF